MRPHNSALVCLCCGGSMLGRRPDALWCSMPCRVKGNRIIKAGEAAGEPYGHTSELLNLGISIGVKPIPREAAGKVKGGGGTKAIVSRKSVAAVARAKAKRAAKARERRALRRREE